MEALETYSSSESEGSSEGSDVSETSSRCGKRQRLGSGSAGAPPEAEAPARPSLLPPAAALLDGSYVPPPAAQQRALEQAVLHQGRSRTFPHAAGTFATHVFIAVPTPPSCLDALDALLRRLRAALPDLQPIVHAASAANAPACSNGGSNSGGGGGGAARLAQPLYHVSLSRTVPLLLHQIQPLVEDLRRRLRQQDVFSLRLGPPEVFANDDRSRTFLSLAAVEAGAPSSDGTNSSSGGGSGGVCSGDAGGEQQQQQQRRRQPRYCAQLVALCHAVSAVFVAHGLPRFYADPQPHASVAWLLNDQREQLAAALHEPEAAAAAAALAAQPWQLRPAAIVCKAGQREHVVWQAAAGEPP